MHNFTIYKKIHKDRGSALFIAIIMMLAVSVSIINGVASPVLRDTKMIQESGRSKNAFVTAESGLEDVVLRLKNRMIYDESETLQIGDISATIIVDMTDPSAITISSEGMLRNAVRRAMVTLSLGDGVAFNYGVQAGNGGLVLENSSSIRGNVSSNGIVVGSNSNMIRGTVISAGLSGLISGVHATSSAFAHTLQDSIIDGDAYYQNISESSVAGLLHPNSPDQASKELPISDEQIEEWKTIALSGGIINSPCPYKITDTRTIGPVKINCDLEISGNNFTLSIAGHVWVDGNITIKNGPTIQIVEEMSGKGLAIIADNDSNKASSGIISLDNSAIFEGAGDRSYILFISGNTSASLGGSLTAINVANTVSGDLLVYAKYGQILLQNSIDLKEVSAYKIRLKNTAEVIYETGLINTLFDSGPSGGFAVDSWAEIE